MAMAKRGRPKKAKKELVRVPHETHLASLVRMEIAAKIDAKNVKADVAAKVKAAKKLAGLDGDVFNFRVKLEQMTEETASRKAERMVLALYRGGYLTGDLLSRGPDLESWASEIEAQFRQTNEEGIDLDLVGSPVFDGTDSADADETATAPDDFDDGVGDEAKRKARIAEAEADYERRAAEKAKSGVSGDEAAERLTAGIKPLKPKKSATADIGDQAGTYTVTH
jgi:hypothetical protein